MKTLFCYLLAIALSLSLIGCSDLNISDRIEAFPIPDINNISFNNNQTGLSEAAPPILIRKLGKIIDSYQPQVSILDPRPDEVLDDTTATVQIKVTDYPLFKDENLEMGPNLHLILDNQPDQEIYSLDEPIVLENLEPGTHTIRVFAARPWHESFKNKGAYAETTFHVLTKTQGNNPDPQLPLLTYSRPNRNYGAEPIMLDFYLSHLPSSDIIKNSATEGLPTWRVKATVNGESFILDQWQPVYLSGFKEGNNWIQLELIDDEGNSINNVFNNTVRLITYNPELDDSLARIVTGEIELQEAITIVDPNYKVPVEETLQEVTEEVEEDVTTESEIIQEETIPTESKVIEQENILEDKSEVIEEKVRSETEIVTETPEVIEEQIIESETSQEDTVPAKNPELSEKEVKTKTEILPKSSVSNPEEISEEKTNQQNTISVDKSELVEEEVRGNQEQAINTTGETEILDLAIVKEIPQLKESGILPEARRYARPIIETVANQAVLVTDQEVIEAKKQNSLPETLKTLENLSVSEAETDQGTDLVSVSKEPFNVTVNLDQWIGNYLRIVRDKIVEIYHRFIN
ncbi:MAG: hypothetical protein AB4372_29215 [Xenococcus sp. (in: cyanobacteria)]